MSYLVLSRKYRPQTFEDVVGQEHVIRTLKNAITSGRTSHAYIFAGPRGIGKTTTARILAKALNCAEGTSAEPCGKCTPCREIAESRSLDVLEIDGATYRGVDKIREDLQDYLRHPPMKERYKVVIIDEVHMLTSEAFNALLKVLEEPPPNVVFIFATTMPQKVIPTILSRCQRFDFRRLPVDLIVDTLKKTLEEESVEFDPESLRLIARKADGGMRDALSLADQAISFSDGKLRYEELLQVFGIISEEVFFSITKTAMTSNTGEALDLVDKLMQAGHDPESLLIGLLEHLRLLLIASATGSTKALDLPEHSKELYAGESERFSQADVHRMTRIADEALNRIGRSAIPRMVFEKAVVDLTMMDTTVNIRELLGSLGGREVEPAPVDIKGNKLEDMKDNSSSSAGGSRISLDTLKEKWLNIVDEIGKERRMVSSFLRASVPTALNGKIIELSFPQTENFGRNNVERNIDHVRKAVSKILGAEIRIKTKLANVEPLKDSAEETVESEYPDEATLEENPTVSKIMNLFNGKIVS